MRHGDLPKYQPRPLLPGEADALAEGTVYDGFDPEAAEGLYGDMHTYLEFERLVEGGQMDLYHKELDVTITVQTEAAAEVYKQSGWTKATKEQSEKKREG